VVLWVGIKLVWEYLYTIHWVPFGIPKVVAIGGVIVLFVGSFLYARAHQEKDAALLAAAAEAEKLLAQQRRSAEDRRRAGLHGGEEPLNDRSADGT
jgi:hypothetical protein